MRTFLIGIARTLVRVEYRRHARDFSDVALLAKQPETPVARLPRQESCRQLEAALARLPSELRAVLELYDWEELATPQIARAGRCGAEHPQA